MSLGKASFKPIWIIILTALIGGVAGAALVAGSPRVQRGLGLSSGKAKGTSQVPLRQKIILEESSAISDVARKVSPAVVSVTSKHNVVDFFGQVYSASGGGDRIYYHLRRSNCY